MPVRPEGAENYEVPVLTDGTVTLRRLESRDVPQLARNCADPVSARFTTVPLGYTEDDARWYVEEFVPDAWRSGREYNWAAVDAATDRLLGTVGLNALRGTTADVGLNFGPHARGTGAAEAACRLLLEHAFDRLGLTYAYWMVKVPNWASRKLAWRLGFHSPVRIDGFMEQRGASVDAWILTLGAGDPPFPRSPWDGPSSPGADAPRTALS
ncbi:GNAT family N-acetyltransferase [Kocuria sp. M1R5S2]|uniref:GNAT family N-acetyltransferase n=1 Tax=Kocuria rhizosphaerae TaxID=3376285 RepID=UPI0037A39247